MKTLTYKLNESLLDDEEDLVNNDNALIEQFLKDNYKIKGTYTIKNNIVDVKGDIEIINHDIIYLTNDLFSFGEVTGSFTTFRSYKLKTLKGGPKKIGKDFICSDSISLTDLQYAPEYVGVDFYISGCDKIKNLKGAPKHIGGGIFAHGCTSLTSLSDLPKYKHLLASVYLEDCTHLNNLDGLPAAQEYSFSNCDIRDLKYFEKLKLKEVGGFSISYCENLTSLDGCPDTVDFLDCTSSGIKNFLNGPTKILGNLYIDDLKLENLNGFPTIIEGDVYARGTNLTPAQKQKISKILNKKGNKLITK